MHLLITAAVVFAALALARGLIGYSRRRRRERASAIPDALVVRMARGVSARVFVDKDLIDGPKAGVINSGPADLVLCADRLIVATRHGRILELAPGAGSVRCTGPRRLVIEGERPRKDGPMKVRIEALVDEAERWAELARARLQLPAA